MDDLWLIKAGCEECKIVDRYYNFTKSKTGKFLNKKATYENKHFDLKFQGQYYEETVTISKGIKTRYPLAVADKFIDILGFANDGILGLGKDEKSIIYKLYKENLIKEPIYSISFYNSPYLILGRPDFLKLNLVVKSQKTISYKQPLKIHYKFGNESYDKPIDAEISSISSYITGPFELIGPIFKLLVSDYNCHYEEELLMCDCAGKLPEFEIFLQGISLSIPSEHYLITVFYK